MSTRSKTLKVVMAISIVVALLAACSPAPAPTATAVPPAPTTVPTAAPAQPSPTPAPTAAPTEIPPGSITVWTFIDPVKAEGTRDKALKNILESFKAKYPQIEVTVQVQPWRELGPKFIAAAQTGSAPDLCWFRTFDVWNLVQLGLLADLLPYWTEAELADFPIQALNEIGQHQGADYTMALWPSAYTLYYRKDVFAANGITVDDIKTWDGFIKVAQKLTQDTNNDGRNDMWGLGRAMSVASGRSLMFLAMVDAGVEPIDPVTGKANFATEAGLNALNMFTDMITKQKVTPMEALTYATADVQDQFAAGLYAMTGDVINTYPSYVKKVTWGVENIGLARWPTWDGSRWGPAWTTDWELGMWKDSKNRDAAALFLKHLLSTEGDLEWVKTGGMLPTRASTFNDPYLSTPEAEYIRFAFEAMSDRSWSLPWNQNIGTYEQLLLGAEQEVIVNGMDPKTALEAAVRKFETGE